jgi:hypothetical protein
MTEVGMGRGLEELITMARRLAFWPVDDPGGALRLDHELDALQYRLWCGGECGEFPARIYDEARARFVARVVDG